MSLIINNIRRIITDEANTIAGYRADVTLWISDGDAVKVEPMTDELSVRFIVKARFPVAELLAADDERIRAITVAACKKALGLL